MVRFWAGVNLASKDLKWARYPQAQHHSLIHVYLDWETPLKKEEGKTLRTGKVRMST